MSTATPSTTSGPYPFERGYPTPEAVRRAYDDADLTRAVQAYRFFFPTVSGLAMFRGNEQVGLADNRVFGLLDTRPEQRGLTLNSDTPYGPVPLDLRIGPVVVSLPPGPLVSVVLDINQRWVADLGVPGPDAGRGGEHLILPPDWTGEVPDGYFTSRASSHRVLLGIRAVPLDGDVKAAIARITEVRVRPLHPPAGWEEPVWHDFSGEPQDTTPGPWETGLEYWRALHHVVDTEPHVPEYHVLYGELAALGIARGRPFAPDERMAGILVRAAELGNGQMRVQSFADRRPDRVVWPGTQWEWPALRPENGQFAADGYLDVDAREKWFFQAIAASPAMFRRTVDTGSLYWLGLRDATGAYLDGGRNYRLTVPQPVPARQFWSMTVYDAETRSQVVTGQDRAALRSLFELSDTCDGPVVLHVGPDAPPGAEDRWIRTAPGRGWFTYFRIYGPEQAAFDGSWKLPDIEPVG